MRELTVEGEVETGKEKRNIKTGVREGVGLPKRRSSFICVLSLTPSCQRLARKGCAEQGTKPLPDTH